MGFYHVYITLLPSVSWRHPLNLMRMHYWDLPDFPPNVINKYKYSVTFWEKKPKNWLISVIEGIALLFQYIDSFTKFNMHFFSIEVLIPENSRYMLFPYHGTAFQLHLSWIWQHPLVNTNHYGQVEEILLKRERQTASVNLTFMTNGCKFSGHDPPWIQAFMKSKFSHSFYFQPILEAFSPDSHTFLGLFLQVSIRGVSTLKFLIYRLL